MLKLSVVAVVLCAVGCGKAQPKPVAAPPAPAVAPAAAPPTMPAEQSTEEFRVWTMPNGEETFERALVKVVDGVAYLLTKDAKVIKLRVDTMSDDDRAALKDN